MQVNRSIADLKILIVGCGSIGKRHAEVLWKLGAKNLTACDPSPAQRESMRALLPEINLTDDYDAALKDGHFDAVFILTPTAMHLSMAEKALHANCHVFLEKPLANTTAGVAELKALAAEKNRLVMVGFCFRYHEVLRMAKELLDAGTVGRLVNIRAFMGEPFAEIQPNYMNMYYSKYSGAFELVHDLDLAIWYAGQEIDEVHAVYGSFSDMGMDSPDSIELLLRFRDRLAANVHLDFYQHPRRRQIELMGVKGTITVEFASWDRATLSWYNTDTRKWTVSEHTTARNDMFRDEDLEFLEAICENKPIVCTVDEALKSLSVVEQVYQIPEQYR